jgi:hypothetical protein
MALILCGAVLGRVVQGQAAGHRLALLTRVQGEVKLQGARAHMLGAVHEHDHLQLGVGARASLSFCDGGLRINLSGPCEVEVTLRGVMPASSHVVTLRPQGRTTALLADGISIEKAGGARAAELPDDCLITRGTLYGEPALMWWTASEEPGAYRLTLRDAGAKTLLECAQVKPQARPLALRLPDTYEEARRTLCTWSIKQAAPTDWKVSRHALTPGAAYTWILRRPRRGAQGPFEAAQHFVVATSQESAGVATLVRGVEDELARDPDNLAPRTELALWYLTHQGYASACQQLNDHLMLEEGAEQLWERLVQRLVP